MQITSSGIWTQVTDSIFNDDNHYTQYFHTYVYLVAKCISTVDNRYAVRVSFISICIYACIYL